MWCVSFSSLARPSSFGPSSFLIERYLEFSSSGALTERHFALSLCDGGGLFQGDKNPNFQENMEKYFLENFDSRPLW